MNEQILATLLRPEGVYEDELMAIDPEFRKELERLKKYGVAAVARSDPKGRTFYLCEKIEVAPNAPPAAEEVPVILTIGEDLSPEEGEGPTSGEQTIPAPGSGAPPAEAPRSAESVPGPEPGPSPSLPEPAIAAHFKIQDFKVQTRDGKAPKITMLAADRFSAEQALRFAMNKPRGAKVTVMVWVGDMEAVPGLSAPEEPKGEPAPETVKGKEETSMPLYDFECRDCKKTFEDLAGPNIQVECPGCHSMNTQRMPSRISSASGVKPTERDPEKKSRQQLSREIDEQIQGNEISPALADAQAKLGGL